MYIGAVNMRYKDSPRHPPTYINKGVGKAVHIYKVNTSPLHRVCSYGGNRASALIGLAVGVTTK